MCTTARTVYPGFPSRSAAHAVRARSMTRFRFGAPPAANSRDRCSRVTRNACATWAVWVGTPTRRSTSSHAATCSRSVSRSSVGASASASRRATWAVRAAIHSPAIAWSTPSTRMPANPAAWHADSSAPSSGRNAERTYIGMRGKRAGSARAAGRVGAAFTSSTTASTSRCARRRSTAGRLRHRRTEPASRGYPDFTARRAVKSGYPRDAGSVRLCRSLPAVERLLAQRLVDAVVLDVKAAPTLPAALALPARFPHIPMYVLSAFRPDDGALLSACHAAGFAGILVEGVDHAIAGEWIAARTAQVARREALADAPKLLRLTDRLQVAAWEEVLRRVGVPTQTAHVAQALRVTREHLSREFAAGGAPNLKRVIDLARTACAADLLGNPGYSVRQVVRILGYASPSHLAGAARRVAGATPQELRELGPRGVLARFLRGRTRSRI